MLSRPGDILLVAGKGHETYQIVGDEKRHFDDREAIFDELLRRGVLIRVVGPDGWLRMCMGADKEMEQFRNALTEALRIVESR